MCSRWRSTRGSADWRSHIDVELTSVRSIAGRDLITVTNTFTDTAGERVHTLHTTVVGVTAEDLRSGDQDGRAERDDART